MESKRLPVVGQVLMAEVRRIAEMGMYMDLPGYDGVSIILLSELLPDCEENHYRINTVFNVGQKFLVKVIRVRHTEPHEYFYPQVNIDLSMKQVTPEEAERYNQP